MTTHPWPSLTEALTRAHAIEQGYVRAEALTGLAPHLATWAGQQPALAYVTACTTLHMLAARPRRELLQDLEVLLPSIWRWCRRKPGRRSPPGSSTLSSRWAAGGRRRS